MKASHMHLIQSSNEGEMGKFLARTFAGKRGHTNPRADSDFLIVFDNEGKVPTETQVRDAITTHYKELGYEIEDVGPSRPNTWAGTIAVPQREFPKMIVVVSVRYPHESGHCSIRVTTDIML